RSTAFRLSHAEGFRASALQALANCAFDPRERAVHCGLQGGVTLFYENRRQAAQDDFDGAALVGSAARAVHVLDAHARALDRTRELAQLAVELAPEIRDRKSTRLNSSHVKISYAVFCLKKKKL